LKPCIVAARRPIKSDLGQERLIPERRRERLAQKREPFRRGAGRCTDDRARKINQRRDDPHVGRIGFGIAQVTPGYTPKSLV
jgi:hypothetical protein